MRLIDADALQAIFNAVSTYLLGKAELCKDAEHMVRAFAMTTEMIQDAQTVDAALVVRCKDCIYLSQARPNASGFLTCAATGMDITPCDFCSWGERRPDHAED